MKNIKIGDEVVRINFNTTGLKIGDVRLVKQTQYEYIELEGDTGIYNIENFVRHYPTFGDMTKSEKIALVTAALDGNTIEMLSDSGWCITNKISDRGGLFQFYPNTTYRIKEEDPRISEINIMIKNKKNEIAELEKELEKYD